MRGLEKGLSWVTMQSLFLGAEVRQIRLAAIVSTRSSWALVFVSERLLLKGLNELWVPFQVAGYGAALLK